MTLVARSLHGSHIWMPGSSAAEFSARDADKITSEAENIFAMPLMTKLTLTLTLTDPHDDA